MIATRHSTCWMLGLAAVLLATGGAARAHGPHHGTPGIEEHESFARYRSPGLAAALSLTPVPVDFGNFYAENIGWGVAYTAAELALMVPMIWVGSDHMGHGYNAPWSSADRNAMIGLVAGYVVLKLGAGYHASRAAHAFNEEQERAARISALAIPAPGGGLGMLAVRF